MLAAVYVAHMLVIIRLAATRTALAWPYTGAAYTAVAMSVRLVVLSGFSVAIAGAWDWRRTRQQRGMLVDSLQGRWASLNCRALGSVSRADGDDQRRQAAIATSKICLETLETVETLEEDHLQILRKDKTKVKCSAQGVVRATTYRFWKALTEKQRGSNNLLGC